MTVKYWLVTYEWIRFTRGSEWRRENDAIKGCPGSWWFDYLKGAKERKDNADYRFLFATPISKEAYQKLT